MKEQTDMKYAIVYSSRTGNTKMLAERIKDFSGDKDCIYFGLPSEEALNAQRIYVGFWTDKGSCDEDTAKFLKMVEGKEVFLFGTAGFGENQEYFDKILKRTAKNLPKTSKIIGRFMCQGKMPMSVRERYEKMSLSPIKIPNLKGMIENFDKALTHPNEDDLKALEEEIIDLNKNS